MRNFIKLIGGFSHRFFLRGGAKKSGGYTFIEMLITIAIVGILSATILSSISKIGGKQALDKSVLNAVSLLENARSSALSSKNAIEYSVHFTSSQMIFFVGTTYTSGVSTNVIVTLDPKVTISAITLSGGGSNVTFERLTGATFESGTIKMQLVSNSATFKTISISATGIININ